MNYRITIISTVLILLSGCSSIPKYTISPDWKQNELAEVYIYRTDVAFHSLNPEKPYFYIDDKEVAKLGTGQSTYTKVTPGKHIITAKEPILFMPAYENGRLEFNAEPNMKYYIRYSKDFSSINVYGPNVVASGTTSLQMANEEYFKQRK